MDNYNHQKSSDYISRMFKSKEDLGIGIKSNKIETLKILLPYLSLNYRKNLSILIKIMELEDTIEYFNNLNVEEYEAKPIPPTLKSELLNLMMDNCSSDIQNLINNWQSTSKANTNNTDNIISSLISLLPSSKQILFENLEILQKIIEQD